MKNCIVLASLLLSSFFTYGQTEQKEKVKIALLGSMHFTPSTQDKYSNDELKLTAQKQKELEKVISKLADFNPDQICIEVPVENQGNIDHQYHQYLEGKYSLKLNEIDLLGFQTAKRLNLPRLTCINYSGKFDTEPSQEAALQYDQQAILDSLNIHAKEFIQEINVNANNLSMTDNFIYLNSQNALDKNLSIYTKYYVNIGKGKNYEGTDLVSEWYKTNLHIYTNILRKVRPTDQTILVIFGQGHIPILKHLFESNPDFEIIEVKALLE